ncbi:2S seed storage protein-like [Bidens hawaiensis]|uniref:2S seed storage protein-like n=1 Tax=Bidens hawaiensis TaxID=980011 RepID=UPI0040490B06
MWQLVRVAQQSSYHATDYITSPRIYLHANPKSTIYTHHHHHTLIHTTTTTTMAKIIALALAFTALVAFATAHTTIVTTTIEENPVFQKEKPCRQPLEGKRFDQCRMFLQQPQFSFQEQFPQMGEPQEFLEECCKEIKRFDEPCQCKAVKQAFREAQKEMQEQQGQLFDPFFGHQQTQQLREKAQALPNLCNLKSRQCSIGKITTSVTQEDNAQFGLRRPVRPFGSQQQCSQTDIQRPVQTCQRYVSQQVSSPRTLLMSINQKQGQQQELQECCNELQYIKKECQCPAIMEVAQRVMTQPQHKAGFFGGDRKDMVRQVVQSLPNECNLEVQQCSIPFA